MTDTEATGQMKHQRRQDKRTEREREGTESLKLVIFHVFVEKPPTPPP